MPTPATKQKIKSAAVQLFNQDGMANVRLQAIADEAVLSVGNLTYHYRNKEALIEAIWADILEQCQVLLAEFRVVPLFEDLERQLRAVFQLQQHYQFFYIDTLDLLRSFPSIANSWREHQKWQTTAVRNMLDFNVARGAFQTEMNAGFFDQLAEQFWFVSGRGFCLSGVGFPSENLPVALAMILAVDRPLDMCRTVVNISGDSCVSVLVGHSLKAKT